MLEGVFGLSPVHLLCNVRFQLLPQGHNIVGSISAGNNISIRMIATCDTTLVGPAVAAAAAAAFKDATVDVDAADDYYMLLCCLPCY